MQQTQAMIAKIRHPHASRRHGNHANRPIELPERRALFAPSSRALQPTGGTLYLTKIRLDINTKNRK